ncbi:hypothetical protein HII31_04714 [Pseudocercospora fuligena]|uniref:Uncharacterized protein n=1 Tax=Pseudocercospora fuligena TaxID=685502 RepID=A0A8H6RPL5_9PEZI|nr:hypothetical protein HII31_04714 [Pseudocercospora fuligena]
MGADRARSATIVATIIAVLLLLPAMLLIPYARSSISFKDEWIEFETPSNTSNIHTLFRRYLDCDWDILNSNKPEQIATQPSACIERVRKGQAHICRMKAPHGPGIGSRYDKSGQLAEFGWESNVYAAKGGAVEQLRRAGPGIKEALEGLEIDTGESAWKSLAQVHEHNTPRGASDQDAKYRASMGAFDNLISLKDGTIIAQTNYGPRAEYAKMKENGIDVPTSQWVPLWQLSDVLGLGLIKHTEGDAWKTTQLRNLKHFIQHAIDNPETSEVLESILKKNKADLGDEDKWPGHTFSMDTAQGKAALATPNGNGIGWILADHKALLGVRTVDRVTIFNCGGQFTGPVWCMYFHVIAV